ncbi:MAG: S24/S26 family peptidase [Ruminococcus sp.]|nr:S24/S26 family peptidase [Ruminococcus sp.]
MDKRIDLKELVPIMQEQLDAGKSVSFIPRGNSMQPLLGDGTDMVVLKKPEGRLHLFDMPLYYRRETDKYVLHRVVGFRKDGTYVMLGDNNVQREYNIADGDIVGVVTSFYHKGKMYSTKHPFYRLYCNVWYYTRPFRRLFSYLKRK